MSPKDTIGTETTERDARALAAELFETLRAKTSDSVGITRESFAAGEEAAIAIVKEVAESHGLTTEMDGAANLVVSLPGRETETPFVAFDMMEEGLAEPLMREWKKGVAEYHTVIIARGDDEIESLEDLRGRNFAFEDAGSTSGYFLPRVALEAAGLSLEKLDDPRGTPAGDAVGYSFANGEINVVAWVNRGLADAGAISNLDWENPKKGYRNG